MNRLIILLSLFITHFSFANAQQYWITGTAVPGGTQSLQCVAPNTYKFYGELREGELRIIDSEKPRESTRWLVPDAIDANIVNHGLHYKSETKAGSLPAWQVTFSCPYYRFALHTDTQILQGEVFQPWGELFIAGGATEAGWHEGKMLLMEQDVENPYIWTWEGELKNRPDNEEPLSFKFQGQDRWGPKSIHPYTQGADILKEKTFQTGGPDTKWDIHKEGRYRIRIDLFNEVVESQIIK